MLEEYIKQNHDKEINEALFERERFEATLKTFIQPSWDHVSGRTPYVRPDTTILFESLEKNAPHEIVQFSAKLLRSLAGFKEAEELDPYDPASAVAIAEAVNLGAKIADEKLYEVKPLVIVAAYLIGARFGYDPDSETYSLFEPRVGTASFHDPGEEIYNILINFDIPEPLWEYGWSGVYRQDEAFEIVTSLNRKDDEVSAEYLADMAKRTTPEGITKKSDKRQSSPNLTMLKDLLSEEDVKKLEEVRARMVNLDESNPDEDDLYIFKKLQSTLVKNQKDTRKKLV